VEKSGRNRGLVRRIVLAGILGLLTCVGVAMGVAARVPIERAGGVVALDGDHLQPWLLHLKHWSGERLIWFEKGRVYSKPGVGPPGASSAAVSCWSFATRTRQDARIVKGQIDLPGAMKAAIEEPGLVWGIAEERRGFPLPAVRCRIEGTMKTPAQRHGNGSVYDVVGGAPVNFDALTSQTVSLATARVLPLRPLWTGLLANTAVYGAAWFGVIVALGSMSSASKRAARVRRGKCPKCAYDLRGEMSGGCPECGWNRQPEPAAPMADHPT
jgi:hypothetical protein